MFSAPSARCKLSWTRRHATYLMYFARPPSLLASIGAPAVEAGHDLTLTRYAFFPDTQPLTTAAPSPIDR